MAVSRHARKGSIKAVARVVGALVAIASVTFFLIVLRTELAVFQTNLWTRRAWGVMVFGVCLYPAIYVAATAVWCLAIKSVGCSLNCLPAVSICMVVQIGKYMPGNVAQHIGRVVLVRPYGVATNRVLMSMAIEAAVPVFLVAVIAFSLLAGGHELPAEFRHWLPSGRQTVIALAGVVAALLTAFVVTRRFKATSMDSIPVDFRYLPACFVIQALVFLMHGAIACLILYGVFRVEDTHFVLVTAVFAGAWVAGFVTPGAPAGVGIRETVLTLGLTPIFGTAVAVGLAALLRVVSIGGDGVTLCVGLLIRWWIGKGVAQAHDNLE